MVESIVNSIVTFFEDYNISKELITFIISLFPVLECRGALIAATLLEIPWPRAFLITYIGNILPIPFILLFIRKIFEWMKKVPRLNKIVYWLEERTLKRKSTIDKYGPWGLLLFVAIPVPGTGGWTGSLLAALLHLDFKKSFPIICIGVFIAALIMTLLSYGVLGNLIS